MKQQNQLNLTTQNLQKKPIEETFQHQFQNNIKIPKIPKTITRQSPELPKIFADNSNKKTMIFFWIIFLAIAIITFCLTIIVPQTFQYRVSSFCNNPIGFNQTDQIICSNASSASAGIVVENLNKLNQFILFRSHFRTNSSITNFQFTSLINVSLYSLKMVNGVFKKDQILKLNISQNITISKQQSNIVVTGIEKYNDGYDNSLHYVRQINYQNYFFTINFDKINSDLIAIIPYVIITNQSFSIFGITIRFIFFFLLIITSTVFYHRISKIKRTAMTLQQMMIMLLSPLAILFNDPFYLITITRPNQLNNFFSVMFIINLFAYLFLFWITILDRIDIQNSKHQSNVLNYKKIGFIFILWLLSLVYYVSYAYVNYNQPMVSTKYFNSGSYRILSIFIFALFGILLAYMLFKHVKILLNFKQKIWRNQIFIYFSIFFMVFIAASFFSYGLNIYESIGGRVLMLYVFMNLYVIYIQYMYSPTQNTIQKYKKTRNEEGYFLNVQLSEELQFKKQVDININENYEMFDEQKHIEEQSIRDNKLSEQKKIKKRKKKSEKQNIEQHIQPGF